MTMTDKAWLIAQGRYPVKGGSIPLRQLPDGHLINALLKALADGDPEGFADRLAAETQARDLTKKALTLAEERERRWKA